MIHAYTETELLLHDHFAIILLKRGFSVVSHFSHLHTIELINVIIIIIIITDGQLHVLWTLNLGLQC